MGQPDGNYLNWAFLRRTALSTLVTMLLVSLFTGGYAAPALGARYFLFAFWSLTFFSLTALIFRHLLFGGDKVLGLLFVVGKLASLAGLFLILLEWPLPEVGGHPERSHMIAMIAGIGTPLAVVFLRVIGAVIEVQRRQSARSVVSISPQAAGEVKSKP